MSFKNNKTTYIEQSDYRIALIDCKKLIII
jgi:hypothetical protein